MRSTRVLIDSRKRRAESDGFAFVPVLRLYQFGSGNLRKGD